MGHDRGDYSPVPSRHRPHPPARQTHTPAGQHQGAPPFKNSACGVLGGLGPRCQLLCQEVGIIDGSLRKYHYNLGFIIRGPFPRVTQPLPPHAHTRRHLVGHAKAVGTWAGRVVWLIILDPKDIDHSTHGDGGEPSDEGGGGVELDGEGEDGVLGRAHAAHVQRVQQRVRASQVLTVDDTSIRA
jgi:hypothetical protein